MNGIKTTVFLGAGATRGALKGFHSNGKRILPPLNSDYLTIMEKFVASKNDSALTMRLKRILKFIYENIGIAKTEKPTMEEIFSMLYSAKDFLDIYKAGQGRKSDSLIEIKDFFNLTVHLFHEIVKETVSKNNLYNKLVALLEDGDTVITLNYDTLTSIMRENGYFLSANF